jgi:hypothetical protein
LTYGAAAAKSHSARAPCACSRVEIPAVSETMPVTLLAAEKLPIFSGRAAYRANSRARCAWSMRPSRSSAIVTTSAMVSRQGSSFEWCS